MDDDDDTNNSNNSYQWRRPEDINFEGLVKAKILAPKGLYLPVIPIRIPKDERLLFPLCVRCAKEFHKECTLVSNDFQCPHQSDEERSFTITITTIELREAIAMGYQIKQIFRIWRYNETNDTMFRDFVRMFMRLKVEASGFPSGFDDKDEQKKENWKKDYADKLGIDIKLKNVALNPGLRHISKIVLNR